MTQEDVNAEYRKCLYRVLRAKRADIESSEQYGVNRDLWLYRMHPLPWRMGESHESICAIYDADGKTVATINTKLFSYGYADKICGLLLAALKEVSIAIQIGELDE